MHTTDANNTAMPNTIVRLVDAIVDQWILKFSDYFITQRRVTLSETTTFCFSLAWALWFLFVGVYVGEMALSRVTWTTLFVLATIVHAVSFAFEDISGRAYVMTGYAFMWCFLAILSAWTGSIAPAVPTLIVMAINAAFIAVRLFRERNNRKAGTHVSLG